MSISFIREKLKKVEDKDIEGMLLELIEYKTKEKALSNIPYKAIIDMFNRITGQNVRLIDSNKRHIRARWREGYREKEFETVVRKMNKKWSKDSAMYRFIRISTLFSSKFDEYLNEPEDIKEVQHESKIRKLKKVIKQEKIEKNEVNIREQKLKIKYKNLSEEQKEKVQRTARERYMNEAGIKELNKIHEKIFESVKRAYILRVLEEI